MDEKKGGGGSLFFNEIFDFPLASAPASDTHPLHHTIVLDSGIDARYVRRPGRGLGI